MKRISWLFLVMAVALCACGPKVEPRPPLRLAIDAWPGYAFAFLAEEKGFFEQNGAAVELVLREGVTNSHVLYARDEADGFFDSYPSAIRVRVEGIPTKVVDYADRSSTADGLVGRKDLRSVADLRGKVVSFDEVNSFSHLFVLKLLEKGGIPETGVRFRVVPADRVLEALRKGEIDAGHTWNADMAQALGEGYRLLATAQEVPAVNLDILAFRAEVVRDQPDNVLRIVKSLVQARNSRCELRRTNRAAREAGSARWISSGVCAGMASPLATRNGPHTLASERTAACVPGSHRPPLTRHRAAGDMGAHEGRRTAGGRTSFTGGEALRVTRPRPWQRWWGVPSWRPSSSLRRPPSGQGSSRSWGPR